MHCAGVPVDTGSDLSVESGNLVGPFLSGITSLIAADPGAVWDPWANNGQGDVAQSAFPMSPRVVGLPVYDPDVFAQSLSTGNVTVRVVRIVGFFIAGLNGQVVQGYLTASSRVSPEPASAQLGNTATLAATLTGPAAPVSGVGIEFSLAGSVVGTAVTDTTGRAELGGVPLSGFGVGVRSDRPRRGRRGDDYGLEFVAQSVEDRRSDCLDGQRARRRTRRWCAGRPSRIRA
jgi:hypothetical protein